MGTPRSQRTKARIAWAAVLVVGVAIALQATVQFFGESWQDAAPRQQQLTDATTPSGSQTQEGPSVQEEAAAEEVESRPAPGIGRMRPERFREFLPRQEVRVLSTSPEALIRGYRAFIAMRHEQRDRATGDVTGLTYSLFVPPLNSVTGEWYSYATVASEHLTSVGSDLEAADMEANAYARIMSRVQEKMISEERKKSSGDLDLWQWAQMPSRQSDSRQIVRQLLASTHAVRAYDEKGQNISFGSAFAIAPGYLMTCVSVVDRYHQLAVHRVDGGESRTLLRVEEVIKDGGRQLALLKVPDLDASPVRLSDREPDLGDPVFMAPNLGGLMSTITVGEVSALGSQSGCRVFEVTAPITKGGSGVPVVNETGELVGVSVGTTRRGGEDVLLVVHLHEVQELLKEHAIQTSVSPK